MSQTSIQWTDHSINPIRARHAATGGDGHYCEKISAGCALCYASRLQPRFRMPVFSDQRRLEVETYLDEAKLAQVLRRRTPTKYFWCDMSDLFGSWVPDAWIDRCFAIMALTPQHTHQVLTKRAERMRDYMVSRQPPHCAIQNQAILTNHASKAATPPVTWPLPNVWLGVSVENQHFADERIPLLLQTPAAVRFISAEPLLGPVNIAPYMWPVHPHWPAPYASPEEAIAAGALVKYKRQCLVSANCRFLDWVIVGGESGPGARPFDVAWARSLVTQCQTSGVPVFVKQLGANPWVKTANHYGPGVDAHPYNARYQLKNKKGGEMVEWPEDLRVREFPREAAR